MSLFDTRLLSSSSVFLDRSEQQAEDQSPHSYHWPCSLLVSVVSYIPAHPEQGRGKNSEEGPQVVERRTVFQKPQRQEDQGPER